jgi:hypothetical protein
MNRPRPRIARVFDTTVDSSLPFDPRRPQVTDPAEHTRLLAFLGAGALILSTVEREADRLDPGRGYVVPIGFRTDGEWVWSQAIAYYLDAHGVAPEKSFYHHIRTCRYTSAVPDEAAVERALLELYNLTP